MPDARRVRAPYITHTFRGRRYKVAFARTGKNCDGLCGAPEPNQKAILIAPHLRWQRRLDVLIHEALHACLWDLDEQAVAETATDIAKLLWRLGYRPAPDGVTPDGAPGGAGSGKEA